MNRSKIVVFRADASRIIGHGHVMRCLTLATGLRARGMTVSFICREHEGHLCDLIEDRGFGVTRLPACQPNSAAPAASPYATWLGASWEDDASLSRIAIESLEERPDWLVVDHYALDQRWERALRGVVSRVMVIDDLADRPHDCEVLLDQNLFTDPRARYRGVTPESCVFLLGPQYALLQAVYAELHDRAVPRGGKIRRILIFFGGADNENLTGRALSAVLNLQRSDIMVDVVVASGSRHLPGLRRLERQYDHVHVYSDLPTLAPLMENADLAIGACGSTTWERLCLGLPALVVTLAENQRPVAEELDRHKLVCWLGHQDVVRDAEMLKAVDTLVCRGLEEEWPRRCLEVVDGRGVNRVCSVLTATASTPLQVRHARSEDEALLLEWANDPVTRCHSFSPETISAEIHQTWFRNRLANAPSCRLYIVETEDRVPVGQVRFEATERQWVIDYTLSPAFRGRGLGRRLLEAALRQLGADEPHAAVLGVVKQDNIPSRRVFESLGFEARAGLGVMEYRCVV